MDNEELLREGECPASNCIEELGHAGSHSGDRRIMSVIAQIEGWRDKASEQFSAAKMGEADYFDGQMLASDRVLALLPVLAEEEGKWLEGYGVHDSCRDHYRETSEPGAPQCQRVRLLVLPGESDA